VVQNARDASAAGETVVVSTAALRIDEGSDRDLPPGDYVAVTVSDTGSGMPPHVIERATEPFFTTKGVGKGTGLGLAMVLGFVRQSRGALEIESQPGSGTMVRLVFPVSRDIQSAPPPRTQPIPTGSEPAQIEERRGERILVVEDSAEVLELADEILSGAGYRVTTAMSGDEAITIFDAEHDSDRFHLIFTDLIMPGGMNGLALADAIAQRDEGVSILLTTGYNEELVAGDKRQSAADVLSKPYRRPDLLDRVRQALNRKGAGKLRRSPSEYGHAQE
jgi:CheY-like chemotaxis protein